MNLYNYSFNILVFKLKLNFTSKKNKIRKSIVKKKDYTYFFFSYQT